MSEKGHIAQKSNIRLEMKAGTYYWCACGLSNNQPFCDGSHKGSSFSPLKVEIETDRMVSWCACKQSAKAPFCDGAHKEL